MAKEMQDAMWRLASPVRCLATADVNTRFSAVLDPPVLSFAM